MHRAKEFICRTAAFERSKPPFLLSSKEEKAEIIDHLSEKAVKALLEQPDAKNKKGVRNLFIMVLMYDTAARVQEIIDLKICDLQPDDTPQVKLHGKGGKCRTVPLMADTVAHYHRYMKLFHPGEPAHSEKPLFHTIRKNICSAISDDAIRVFMNKYAAAAHRHCPDVPKKYTRTSGGTAARCICTSMEWI